MFVIEKVCFCCCCRKFVLLCAHACIPACVHIVDNQKCCHRLFRCTDRSKGGQYLRSTDDVTPVELFLERGLKKAGFFFSPPRVIIIQSLSPVRPLLRACLILLFWSILSLQL